MVSKGLEQIVDNHTIENSRLLITSTAKKIQYFIIFIYLKNDRRHFQPN